jgi:phosphoglycerate dehydrogenase-like enzyme
MRVLAIDPHETRRPPFIFRLDRPDRLKELLPQADVVVLTCPLTEQTRGLLGTRQLQALKRAAYLINVAHPDLVRYPDLAEALRRKQLAGAGLGGAGSTLPAGDPLRSMANVVITPQAGPSPEGRERQWRLYRENVRRFVKGERLLCVVGPTGPERQGRAQKP